MRVKDWESLVIGDRVRTRNGPYTQEGIVTQKLIYNGMRWIHYRWIRPDKRYGFGAKRYMSVYLLEDQKDAVR